MLHTAYTVRITVDILGVQIIVLVERVSSRYFRVSLASAMQVTKV